MKTEYTELSGTSKSNASEHADEVPARRFADDRPSSVVDVVGWSLNRTVEDEVGRSITADQRFGLVSRRGGSLPVA